MSSGSWQDVTDSIYIENEEQINQSPTNLLLTKETDHPVLNFDRFNNLNIDYHSDNSFQENNSQPELPLLSNSTLSLHDTDKLSISSSTQSNSPSFQHQHHRTPDQSLQPDQLNNNIKEEKEEVEINDNESIVEEEEEEEKEEKEERQKDREENKTEVIKEKEKENNRYEQQPSHISHTMLNTINHNYPVHILPHADSFASWSPLKKGASIPWLFTQDIDEDQDVNNTNNHGDNDNDSDIDNDSVIHKKKWESLQQLKLQQQQQQKENHLSNKTTTIENPSPLNTPSSLPLNSIADTDTISFIHQYKPAFNNHPSYHHSNDKTFQFSSVITDHHQANESLLLHIKELAHQDNVYNTIKDLDISHQQLTAVQNLNTLLPQLENLNISFNKITNLSGLPLTLKTLKAKSNKLTDIEGFRLLCRLEYLDVNDNALDTFDGIGTLYYLKTILAGNNKLTSCKSFDQMHGLETLSLHGNFIEFLEFEDASMYQLRKLDLSYNRIRSIEKLKGLPKLQELNICHNSVESIDLNGPLNSLSILKMSHNRLKSFDGQLFPNLKLIYIDKNQLVSVVGLFLINHLDTLSLRDQGDQTLQIDMKDIREVRKLYFSGMPIKQLNSLKEFNNLEYLELCSTQLEELPKNFASQVPNLGVLYLSYNYIKNISPLKDLKLLQKLVLIDNRINRLNELVSTVRTLPSLAYLDLRHNPLTYKLYASVYCPAIYKSTMNNYKSPLSRYIAHEHDNTWVSRDAITFDNLPEHWKQRRNTYRSLFITECSSLGTLDNIAITLDERNNALNNVENYVKR